VQINLDATLFLQPDLGLDWVNLLVSESAEHNRGRFRMGIPGQNCGGY
jgi:hypothetical protein